MSLDRRLYIYIYVSLEDTHIYERKKSERKEKRSKKKGDVYISMNKRERRETEERGRLQTIVFACILYERFTRNYGNFAGRFARVESYSFDSLPTKRAPRLVLAEMQNVFVSLRPESGYIFFKASPVSGPAARGTEKGPVGRRIWRGGEGDEAR